jgi:hypothetical protein
MCHGVACNPGYRRPGSRCLQRTPLLVAFVIDALAPVLERKEVMAQ